VLQRPDQFFRLGDYLGQRRPERDQPGSRLGRVVGQTELAQPVGQDLRIGLLAERPVGHRPGGDVERGCGVHGFPPRVMGKKTADAVDQSQLPSSASINV
jgi:hypothetical protein